MIALQPVLKLIPVLLKLLDLDLQLLAPSSPLLLLLLQLLQTRTQNYKPVIPGERWWCTIFHFKPHEHANIPQIGLCPSGCVSLLSGYRCLVESITEKNYFWEFCLFSYWILNINYQYGFQIKQNKTKQNKPCFFLWKQNLSKISFKSSPKCGCINIRNHQQ